MAKPSPRVRALLAWFKAKARDLPWRRNPTPYRVWVSEIMLQQTRVEAVREKYAAFLRRFPTVEALAAAEEDAVLQAWSGLGYYRRARMLHAAARKIVAKLGGEFPSGTKELADLPGIGRYTAGAIASIAFNAPAAIVDGNIERVFARWHGIKTGIKLSAAQKHLWQLAGAWVQQGAAAGYAPRDLNQALMELGALVCIPGVPKCGQCPVAAQCVAGKSGRPQDFPLVAASAAKRDVRLWFAALLDRRGRVFLVRRQGRARPSLLPDALWELPHAVWPESQATPPVAVLGKLLGCKVEPLGEVITRKHSIMDWRVTLASQAASCDTTPRWTLGEARWFTPCDALKAAQASATTKLLRALFASRH